MEMLQLSLRLAGYRIYLLSPFTPHLYFLLDLLFLSHAFIFHHEVARWCSGWDVELATFCRGFNSQPRWQVTLCNPIWHVFFCSGVVISITNCYIRFTFILLCYNRPSFAECRDNSAQTTLSEEAIWWLA